MSRSQLKDEVFMNMALELSRLGTCCRLKVGAVLLRADGGVAATAYVTHEPCLICCRALVRRGVRRVVFRHPYTSIAEQERAERQGILDHFSVRWEQLEGV